MEQALQRLGIHALFKTDRALESHVAMDRLCLCLISRNFRNWKSLVIQEGCSNIRDCVPSDGDRRLPFRQNHSTSAAWRQVAILILVSPGNSLLPRFL